MEKSEQKDFKEVIKEAFKGYKANDLTFTSVLFLIFLTLKLTGHIAWSWWFVAAPLWIPYAIIISVIIVGYSIALLFWMVASFLTFLQKTDKTEDE